MTDLFLSVLGTSASVSALIVFLFLLSPFLNKRYAAKWKYLIWIVLALRLAVLLGGAPGRSAADVWQQWREKASTTAEKTGETATDTGTVPGRLVVEVPAQMTVPLPVQTEKNITALDIAAYIWGSGCLAYIFINITSYCIYRRRVSRRGTLVKDPVVLQQFLACKRELQIRRVVPIMEYPGAASPMILGFLKPVLILPEDRYNAQELFYILKHELVHLKRRDLQSKLLFMTAGALHWFNPLVHLMRKEAVVDMELACDERVVQGADLAMRKMYTETLLSTLHKGCERSTALSTGFYGGKKVMKKRFQNILRKTGKRNGRYILVCAVLLTLSAGTLMGCSVVKDKAEDSDGSLTESAENFPGDAGDTMFAKMAGSWIIDFDRTDSTIWGTGISFGDSMELSESGTFSYYIGIGVGGTGQCAEQGGVVTVEVEPYEDLADEQEILTLQYYNDGGSEYILMDWYDEDVYWVRNGSQDAGSAGEDSAAENTGDAVQTAGETITLSIMKEGIPEEKQARLVAEDGYILYLPEGEWQKESADTWRAVANEDVRLWVAGFESGYSIEQLLADEGYVADKAGMSKQEDGSSYHVRLFEAQTGVWCVFFCYPSEAEEGWGMELPVIADTFAVLLPEEHITETGALSVQVLGYISDFNYGSNTVTVDRRDWVTPESGDWKPEYDMDAGFEIVDLEGADITYRVRSDCTYHVLAGGSGPAVDVGEDEFSVYLREADYPIFWSFEMEDREVVSIVEWYVP
ncbi:M56 family metallopeptidase [Lachnospiraceae bacterium 38-10]